MIDWLLRECLTHCTELQMPAKPLPHCGPTTPTTLTVEREHSCMKGWIDNSGRHWRMTTLSSLLYVFFTCLSLFLVTLDFNEIWSAAGNAVLPHISTHKTLIQLPSPRLAYPDLEATHACICSHLKKKNTGSTVLYFTSLCIFLNIHSFRSNFGIFALDLLLQQLATHGTVNIDMCFKS